MKVDKLFINEKELNYLEFGSGNKIMVILPGLSIFNLMNFKDTIINQYKLFDDEYKIYLFDHIVNINDKYDINLMTKDLIYAFNKLNLFDIYLYGVSHGGILATSIAISTNLVKKLCIVSSLLEIDINNYNIFNNWINLAKDNKYEDLISNFYKMIFEKEVYEANKDSIKSLISLIDKKYIDSFIIYASSIRNINLLNDIDNIKCELFIINDSKDKVFNSNKFELMYKSLDTKINYISYTYNEFGHAVYDLSSDILNKVYNFYKR